MVFESILLLKVNRKEWNVHSIGRAMGLTAGARVTLGEVDGVLGDGVLGDDNQDHDMFYNE